MANEAPNHEAETENETSVIDIRTRDLSEFEEGEAVRVHYRDAADEPHKCITGRVSMHYSDRKALIETDDGRELIIDLSDVTEENIRDFETGETIGRGMFAEPAYHPEKDGDDLRDEILGDEETDDDDDDETAEVKEARRVQTEILNREDVPERMKDDVREMEPTEAPRDLLGLATNLGITVDVAAHEGDDDLPAGESGGEPATLTYEKKVNHCHEKTGKTTTEVREKRHEGEVYREVDGLVGFRSPEHEGVFFLLEDGRVEYDPHDSEHGCYEVGENGEVER